MNVVSINGNAIRREYESAEAYKSLRTNIQFCGVDKKVLVITSCTPGEGKSAVALNLSVSLAETGKKVLLIDADLRKSTILGRVTLNEEVGGLSHYLSRQQQLKEIICATNIKNLHLILPGSVPPNPSELLGNQFFQALLKTVRDIYDYVLIDSPPLGSVIDSAVIAEECDGSILVIESGVINYRFAQEVKEQLEKAGCPILGTVLNKVETRKRGYYSKYYREYQGRYYGKSEEA